MRTGCLECNYTGWIIGDSERGVEVQACDSCGAFRDDGISRDDLAREAALEDLRQLIYGDRIYQSENRMRLMRIALRRAVKEERRVVHAPRRRHSRSGQIRCEICSPLRCIKAT